MTYTQDYFHQCVMKAGEVNVKPASFWRDDAWYLDQENRRFHPNPGWLPLQEGKAEGTIPGGNLSTFILLQGTEFMPDLRGAILFLEDDESVNPPVFDRYLQSLVQQPGFEEVQGIVIGRFQDRSGMTPDILREIVRSKKECNHLPIIADTDCGHTTPRFTFPIGGRARIQVEQEQIEIRILSRFN